MRLPVVKVFGGRSPDFNSCPIWGSLLEYWVFSPSRIPKIKENWKIIQRTLIDVKNGKISFVTQCYENFLWKLSSLFFFRYGVHSHSVMRITRICEALDVAEKAWPLTVTMISELQFSQLKWGLTRNKYLHAYGHIFIGKSLIKWPSTEAPSK